MQVFDETRHEIAFTTSGDCTSGYMDGKLLGYILDNLLSNAIKYSPEGKVIQFELVCQNLPSGSSQAIFSIDDSGIGIPEEDQPKIFDSFYRAQNVGTIPGTGLGLAIVKKMVALHGGRIMFASQVGVGTTFKVTIPFTTPNS